MAAEFKFVFVAMGQGDCCMIRCPDGKVVVVDCGSTSEGMGETTWSAEAAILLRTVGWAGGQGNQVEALILTHKDADHHNKVVGIFNAIEWVSDFNLPSGVAVKKGDKLGKINIKKIYCSDAYADDSPLGKYTGAALSTNVYNHFFATDSIFEVTINSGTDLNNFVRQWNKANFSVIAATLPVANKRFYVLNGVTDGDAWSISFVAGNVPKGYGGVNDGATEDNAKSLITLFEVGGKKSLLTGDATFSTERFLSMTNPDDIQDIEMVQVPHHGSAYASTMGIVRETNPKAAIVSVGFLEHSYRLPRYNNVLERWLDKVESRRSPGTAPYHTIDYWTTDNGEGKTVDDYYNEWTNNGTDLSGVGWNESQTFYYLKVPGMGVIAMYNLLNSAIYLYREDINIDVLMTSQRTQVFKLDKTGGASI